MGGICGKSILRESNSIVPTEEYAANSSIDAKIIQILHDKKVKLDARKDERKQSLTFDAIILKFKIVEDAFLGMKDTYEKFKDTKTDGVRLEDLNAVMEDLGVSVSEKELKEVFDESDMRRDHSLDFDEFVVSIAIGYLLGIIPDFHEKSLANVDPKGVNVNSNNTKKTTSGDEKKKMFGMIDKQRKFQLAGAFNLVVDAYLMFDKDASGTIQQDEMNMILQEKQKVSAGVASKFLNKERWNELDWDQNGTITFQEFLLAFEKWVGIGDDE